LSPEARNISGAKLLLIWMILGLLQKQKRWLSRWSLWYQVSELQNPELKFRNHIFIAFCEVSRKDFHPEGLEPSYPGADLEGLCVFLHKSKFFQIFHLWRRKKWENTLKKRKL